MIEEFLDTIKRVGIFIVCAQAIVQFRPKASYEKYIKVLISLIVLAMVIAPFFKAFGKAEELLISMERYNDFLGSGDRAVWEEWQHDAQDDGILETNGETIYESNIIKSTFNNITIRVEPVEVIK